MNETRQSPTQNGNKEFIKNIDHFATFVSPREEFAPEIDVEQSHKSKNTIGQKPLPNINEIIFNNNPPE